MSAKQSAPGVANDGYEDSHIARTSEGFVGRGMADYEGDGATLGKSGGPEGIRARGGDHMYRVIYICPLETGVVEATA